MRVFIKPSQDSFESYPPELEFDIFDNGEYIKIIIPGDIHHNDRHITFSINDLEDVFEMAKKRRDRSS